MTAESTTSSAPLATSALLATVGNKVRSMRKEKGMTLAKLSEITGLSPAIVSQIERGLANPSFTTLAQLAHGLDIPVGKFFIGQEETRSPVVRKADRRNLKGVAKRSVGEAGLMNCSRPSSTAPWKPNGLSARPAMTPAATLSASGEEFGIIVSGRKDIFLDGECYTLEEGDSISFSSDTPHWYKNSYEEDA